MLKTRKGRIRSWLINQAWVAIVVTFLTIVLGLVLGELQARVGWALLVASLVVILVCFAFTLWMVVRHISVVSFGLAEEVLQTLEKYVSPDKITWMMTTPQMVEWEAKCKAHEVWCISSDLYEDVPEGPFFKVVDDNLKKKGTRYVYFVSDTIEMRGRIEQIIRSHGNHPNLSVKYVSDEFFFLVPKLDIAIYNPLGEKGLLRVAYLGIPAEGTGEHYHACASAEFTDRLVGKLLPLVGKRSLG